MDRGDDDGGNSGRVEVKIEQGVSEFSRREGESGGVCDAGRDILNILEFAHDDEEEAAIMKWRSRKDALLLQGIWTSMALPPSVLLDFVYGGEMVGGGNVENRAGRGKEMEIEERER